jgi:hypothetical protein
MTSGGTSADIGEIRRRYRLIAAMGVSGDIVIIAVFWLLNVLPQDLLLMISALLLASGTMTAYLLVKVMPDRIARDRELARVEPARKE